MSDPNNNKLRPADVAGRQNLTIQWTIIVRVDLGHQDNHRSKSEQDLAKRQDTKANSPENNRESFAVVVVAAAATAQYC